MATWFVDLEAGDNNNSGDSFAITLNGTTTVTNGTTTVTRAAGGFTGLEGRKIYFVTSAGGRTINSVTSDTACVVNATVGAATQTANVGGARRHFSAITTTTCNGLAAGDTIRIMGSETPTATGITAVFTEFSPTVTLLGGSSIQLNDAESAWTGVANVTVTQSATAHQGTNSVSAAIAAGFTTGKAAYYDLGSTIDFSAYRILTFWMQQLSGTLMTTANDLSVRLCSDSLGVTAVSTFNVPGIRNPGAAAARLGSWVPMAIDLGSAVSSTVRSIAVYVGVDRAAQTFLFDDFRLWSAGTSTRVVSDCEAAWTASANVTATAVAGRNGTNMAQIAIAAGFTTGKAAYRALGSAFDLSDFTKLTMWLAQSAGTLVTAGQISLRLCSDTTGDVTVDTLPFPAFTGQTAAASAFGPLTLTTGGEFGASIQSIALYVESDLAAQTFQIDHIVATNNDGLDFQHLYGTEDALGAGGDDSEPWFQLRQIDPVTCLLAPYQAALASIVSRGFVGASGFRTLWRRPTLVAFGAAAAGIVRLDVAGTVGNPLVISGGWDRTDMSTQTLETWAGVPAANGNGVVITVGYQTVEKIAPVGCLTGISLAIASLDVTVNSPAAIACTTAATTNGRHDTTITMVCYCNTITVNGTPGSTFSCDLVASMTAASAIGFPLAFQESHAVVGTVCNGATAGAIVAGSRSIVRFNEIRDNGTIGLQIDGPLAMSVVVCPSIANNGTYGVSSGATAPYTYTSSIRVSTSGNTTAAVSIGSGLLCFSDSSFGEATIIGNYTAGSAGYMFSSREGGTTDLHRVRSDGMLVESDASVRHTASGIAWRIDVTNITTRTVYNYAPLFLGRHYVPAGPSTISVWLRRTNASLNVRLSCPGYQVPGINADITADMTAAVDTWEEVSITVSPTTAACIYLEVRVWGAVASAYVDDLTVAGRAVDLDVACLGLPFSHPTFPDAGDVRDGVSTGDGVTTGTLELPAVEDVEIGVQYGEDGTEFTGTYAPGGDTFAAIFF